MTQSPPPNESRRIDRFVLLRALGQGAQGLVYAAHDPRLDRQVAIKTLQVGAADSQQAHMLIESARMASSLSHPNIVPVFEVGMHGEQPFVVFEYVEGQTLADMLHAQGPLSMKQAVVMMSQVLAGMAHVHASGLLHGDIKPANILIGANGVPRVTDFGISRRLVAASGEQVTAGTVRYMAPEALSEGRADYRSDVFALGLLFYEMLTGRPAVAGINEYAQIYRILNAALPAPSESNPRIDARLDAIVMRALARDPAQRYADAAEMKQELDRFRVPAEGGDGELHEPKLHGTVEFLLRRMALKSDFPALSVNLNRINRLCSQDDDASLKTVSELVMRDFALAQKVLRLVNAAGFGAGKVTRVSQAVTLLGLSRLRAVATALLLANGGRTGPGCPAVAAALTDAFVTAVIARNVGRMSGLSAVEELFICGMFGRLGQLLVLYYLKEEHEAIVRRIADEHVDAASASRAVLGLSFDEFGAAVARQWNFPDAIVAALRPLPPGELMPAGSEQELMWQCAGYARELCNMARDARPDALEPAFAAHRARFAAVVAIETPQLRALIAHSVDVAFKYVVAAELKQTQTALLENLQRLSVEPQVPHDPLTPNAAGCSKDTTTVLERSAEVSRDTIVLPPHGGVATDVAGDWRAQR